MCIPPIINRCQHCHICFSSFICKTLKINRIVDLNTTSCWWHPTHIPSPGISVELQACISGCSSTSAHSRQIASLTPQGALAACLTSNQSSVLSAFITSTWFEPPSPAKKIQHSFLDWLSCIWLGLFLPHFLCYENAAGECPGCPVVRTLCFPCSRPGLDTWSGTKIPQVMW